MNAAEKIAEQLKDWPEGMDFCVASAVKEALFFFKKGQDHMTAWPEVQIKFDGSMAMSENGYIVVYKEEYELEKAFME